MRIGIDLGGTKTEGVLLSDDGVVLARERVPTPRNGGYPAILNTVVELAAALRTRAASDTTIGVGIPGTVSTTTDEVKNANTTELIGHPLRRDLEERLNGPVRVANDANCFAVAEALHGAGRDGAVVFGIILGTGVGGGLVWNGEARQGVHGIAGEWGHSPIEDREDHTTPTCYCGLRGCIETRLSGPAFEGDYRRIRGGDEHVAASDVFARAKEADVAAQRAVDRYLRFFGEGVARILHVVDPDVVVLGGGMANADVLYERGPSAVEAVLFSPTLRTPIRKHELGDSAGVFGAAWLWGRTPLTVE